MVNLYIPAQQQSDILRQDYFAYSQAGTLDVLGATFQQTLYENPMSSAYRAGQQFFFGNTGRKLTPEEYQASEFFREGISVGRNGIYESAASMLADRYDEREARNLILNRSRGSAGLVAAQLGVGLVGSMLDPLNIAASFIPVMGQARYAAMVAKHGKAFARLRKGAAEGAVGAAGLEFIVYPTALYEQNNDYGIANSLMNIAFGTTLGGGFHVGFGAIGDALKKTTPETREQILRTAVAQTIEGRPVETNLLVKADPILRNDPIFRGANQVPERVRQTPLFEPRRKGNKVPDILRPAMASAPKPKTLTEFIRGLGGVRVDDPNVGDVKQIIDKDPTIISSKARRKRGKKGEGPKLGPEPKYLDRIGEAAFEAGYFRERPTVEELLDAFNEDYKGAPRYRDEDIDALQQREAALALKEEAERYGIDAKGISDEDFIRMLDNRREIYERADEIPADAPDGLTEEEFFRLREQQYAAIDESQDVKDFEARMAEADAAAEEFDADELGVINRENEQLIADINFLIEQGAVPDDFVNEIAVYDGLIAKAEEGYGAATRAAANCMVRNV